MKQAEEKIPCSIYFKPTLLFFLCSCFFVVVVDFVSLNNTDTVYLVIY